MCKVVSREQDFVWGDNSSLSQCVGWGAIFAPKRKGGGGEGERGQATQGEDPLNLLAGRMAKGQLRSCGAPAPWAAGTGNTDPLGLCPAVIYLLHPLCFFNMTSPVTGPGNSWELDQVPTPWS